MKNFTTLIGFLALVFIASACTKNSGVDADAANFIGDWKVLRSTTIVSNGKQIDSYKFNFSLKFNTDGTCFRTQPFGTDTMFWALQTKQNILVLASLNQTSSLSGYRLKILKNEPQAHKWEDITYTSFLKDTAWIPAVYTDTYDVTPK